MRVAHHGALRLRPAKDRNPKGRPVLNAPRALIVLLFQAEQAEMAGVARREARDFHVVAHDVFFGRERVGLAFEESLLEIPARPPTQHLADVQVLAQDVPHHVLRVDALGGLFVVRAAGRVDVMVARIPSELRGINPPRQAEVERLRLRANFHPAAFGAVLRPARDFEGVVARRQ